MRLLRGLVALSLLALQPVLADRKFYASAVSYCASNTNRVFDVSKFLLEYDPDAGTAGSISFDISAASVDPNLSEALSNPILNFELIAYGINAVNTSINLCDLLGGVLCPLPQYDFVGSATIPLPSIVAGKVNIPGAGYWIPDLEATAYVRLLRVEDNSEAACLRVDLSNGKTTRWSSVSWALGGLALGCVLLSFLWFLVGTLAYPTVAYADTAATPSTSKPIWASLGRRKERLFLLMSLLQFVATTGILSLEYPLIYEAFTSNFAWSLGIIRINPVQSAIDSLRNGTGGNLTQLAGRSNLVGGTRALQSVFTRRDYAPLPSAEEIASSIFSELGRSLPSASSSSSPSRLSSRALHALSYVPSTLARRADADDSLSPTSAVAIPDVQNTSTINAVELGIPHQLVNLDISPYNGFTTAFINFLFLFAIAVGLIILGGAFWALLRMFIRRRQEKRGAAPTAVVDSTAYGGRFGGLRRRTSGPFMTVVRAGTLRLLLISWYPLCIWTFYQWTLGSSDSYAPIVLSVFTIVCVALALLFLALRFFLLARRTLHTPTPHIDGFTDPEPSTAFAPSLASSPFRPAPTAVPITPNPTPSKALPKAERRVVEDLAVGQLLSAGAAPYSPFWNAYKVRSRRTTAKRRNWWKGRGWWFGLVELLAMPFVLACFVSFAKRSGWTQSVALVVVESILFLSLCIFTPYEDKSSNGTHIFWQLLRVVIAGALITFNQSIGLNEIVRVAIGAVLAVIESILVILFFILLVIDFVQLIVFLVRGLKARRRARNAETNPVGAAPPMMMQTTTRDSAPIFAGAGAGEGGAAVGRDFQFEPPHHDGMRGEELEPTRSSLTLHNNGSGNGVPPAVGKSKNL
ncbi:hypothetical protein JCM8097_008595 [Rhodosporidiobolus ruineniae]